MWSGVFQTKNFEGSAKTRRAQMNVAVKTVRFNAIAVLSSVLYFLYYIAVVSRLKSVLVRKSSRKFIRVVFYFSWLCPVSLRLFCKIDILKVLFINVF